jgi:hypothetical protein
VEFLRALGHDVVRVSDVMAANCQNSEPLGFDPFSKIADERFSDALPVRRE